MFWILQNEIAARLPQPDFHFLENHLENYTELLVGGNPDIQKLPAEGTPERQKLDKAYNDWVNICEKLAKDGNNEFSNAVNGVGPKDNFNNSHVKCFNKLRHYRRMQKKDGTSGSVPERDPEDSPRGQWNPRGQTVHKKEDSHWGV